ncbi:MAG: cell division protein FtsZ [Bacteroidetes bacterium]|nr:MAG: cell division protein FtsZ [Bacteroidota bacterium]
MNDDILEFNSPKGQSSIIKVIGVGGGGGNAVNNMYNQGIKGVDFIVCNTDAQALEASPVPNKIQLGNTGLGAGAVAAVAREAILQKKEELKKILEVNTQMLFITAGMGGGTGTGAAPIIAEIAKELGILTVGIVTLPFSFEGRKRKQKAEEGIKALRSNVDTLLVICNDKLRQLFGNKILSEAFKNADNIVTTAARGIAEIITETGYINVDFEDVKTVIRESGVAIMGNAEAEGEDRAQEVIKEALSSPLLNDNDIKGAQNILLYVSSGREEEISLDEISEITDHIQDMAGDSAEIIWGNGFDESLGKKISVTLIATGFQQKEEPHTGIEKEPQETRIVHSLEKTTPSNNNRGRTPSNEIKRVSKDQPENKEYTVPYSSHSATNGLKESATRETVHKLYEEEGEAEEEPEHNAPQKQWEQASSPYPVRNETPEQAREREERRNKLKKYSLNNKSLEELEREPAYQRRNVELKEVKPSNEPFFSKYALFDHKNEGAEIRSSNSFLHDNVD